MLTSLHWGVKCVVLLAWLGTKSQFEELIVVQVTVNLLCGLAVVPLLQKRNVFSSIYLFSHSSVNHHIISSSIYAMCPWSLAASS